MKLKNAVVGQRVELKVKQFESLDVGAKGTIVCVAGYSIGVQWDNFTDGHECQDHITEQSGSGWYVLVEELRKLKEPKPSAITVGSRVRITELRGYDGTLGVCVGDVYTVVKVHSDGDVNVRLQDGNVRCMFKDQIKLLN